MSQLLYIILSASQTVTADLTYSIIDVKKVFGHNVDHAHHTFLSKCQGFFNLPHMFLYGK